MIDIKEVIETNKMIKEMNLDVRTITLGISLLDCMDTELNKMKEKIYTKITTLAADLVKVGNDIEREFGVPIVNKRIEVTPISLICASTCKCVEDYVEIAKTLDEAAKKVNVNFLGGFGALVSKAMTKNEELLIKEDENSGVNWIDIDKMVSSSSEDHMKKVYAKLVDKLKEGDYN